jgi:hypothetical protein
MVINTVSAERSIYVHISRASTGKIVEACEDQETALIGVDVLNDSLFMVYAYANDLDLSGCKTAINGPGSEPERVIVRVS